MITAAPTRLHASTSLPRATPESQGIPSSAILDFAQAADEQSKHLHSFMLLRHGHVIAEAWWRPYQWSQSHMLFSLTKSFSSTAIGLAISEGKLSLDDAVISFFPDQLPANVDANLRKMKLRHLLMMGTGHTSEPKVRDTLDWVRAFLACPPEREPGSLFLYNSAGSHMLSAIVQKVTGQTMRDYLMPRLFAPLGINMPTWETDPSGHFTGGWGMDLKTEDIAKFGQLYLNQGRWQQQQLIPADWVRLATSRQIDNGSNPESDWNQGYCFQFWRCRHNAYRGDGAFGQYCVVMPDQDTVLAMTGGMGNLQLILDLAWKHLLPAMSAIALQPDTTAHSRLQQRLGSLALPTAAGALSSPISGQISGRTFRFAPNDHLESLALQFGDGQCQMAIGTKSGMTQLTADFGKWASQISDGRPVAASYAWTDENTCQILAWHTATPFSRTLTCRFEGNEVSVTLDQNVSFGPTRFGPLVSMAS